MGVQPIQTQFARMIQPAPGTGYGPTEYMGAPATPVVPAVQVANEVMRLPSARTVTLMVEEPWDCTDWYLSNRGEDPNNFKYQQTRLVGWDKTVVDYDNSDKQNGTGFPVPLYAAGTSRWNRVGVTAPKERPVTVHVWWTVLPLADVNPDGPGAVGSAGVGGAAGQVMWTSVAGPDKGIFGTGPFGFSLVGLNGLNAIAWPAGAYASLVVPAGSTYEIALNFAASIDNSYLNGVGRASQAVRTRLFGNLDSYAEFVGATDGIPPSYFDGFSTVPEVSPVKFVNRSFSMMTVTTY